uniref:bcl-2-like protein 13 n=1 Tax=Scatophagus argus TaxID=75038 RepID=UPI001ED7F173|nr:bcl-2-like protein 13 [Scatophagus argus]
MGDVDPEDTKSIDSSNGAALAGEENHSSNSDMVHLEREEAEMLEEAEKEAAEEERVRRTEEEEEEDEELQTSVLSVLGGERELVELREEEEEQDLHAPETEELLVSAEEPHMEREPAEFRQVVPPMALPPLPIVRLDPPSTTSTPVPSTTTSEVEELYSAQGLLPPSILAPMAAEPPTESLELLKFSQIPLSDVEEHSSEASQAAPEKLEPEASQKTAKPLSSTELLCGGAALVAIVGVVAYGAVAYCRK